jgi:hypothetical protein
LNIGIEVLMLPVGYSGPQMVNRPLSEVTNKELNEETRSAKQSQSLIKAVGHCQGGTVGSEQGVA